ncbi:MAG: AAA family ATPase [Oligoflexus sp.]
MTENSERKFPRPEEVQKEFEDFVKNRFGNGVNIFTSHMNEESSKSQKKATVEDEGFQLDFDYKPKDIKRHLDRFVIRQDEAKIALAIAVCDHYNHAKLSIEAFREKRAPYDYAKQNVMILGPTGVGKTYLIRKVAELIGVPFVKADATRFSETGYVGANVDDLVRDLVAQADGDVERAQYGIVYLDEADKLAASPRQQGRDVSGRGVQFGLLRLMEETEVDLRSGNDIQSQIQALMDMQKGKSGGAKVNTRNILFIVSGAFSGLEEIISKRLNKNPIGFNRTLTHELKDETDFFRHATTQDFIDYGFEPEFIGRLPIRVSCDHLNQDDLFHILKDTEGSIIRQYQLSFAAYGIDLKFEEDALRAIAEKASLEKTGARSLMTVCESVLRQLKFELPSSKIQELSIDQSAVEDPQAFLQKVLAEAPSAPKEEALRPELLRYTDNFRKEHEINLRFSKELEQRILTHCEKEGIDVYQFCSQLLHSYEHGLKLVQQRTGQQEFLLPVSVYFEPQNHLEKLIIESYGPAFGRPNRNSQHLDL